MIPAKRFLLLAIAIGLFVRGTLVADEGTQEIKVSRLWKTFAVTDAREVTAITTAVDGRYLATGNTYSKQEGQGHWWGEINTNGKKVRETKNWDPHGFRNSGVIALVQTSDRSVWVVAESTISKFTAEGKTAFSKRIYKISPIDRFSLNVSVVLEANNGDLILAGQTRPTRDGADAWVMRIDKSGKRIWEKRFDYGEDEWIVSGVRTGENQYVFAAISGKHDKFGAGFSGVRLIQCTGQGDKTGECFARGSITPTGTPKVAKQKGHIVVAYSKASFPRRDAWLMCVDSKLKKVWDKQIAPSQVTAFTPAVAASSDGTLVVTWNAMRELRLWRFDTNGKSLSEKSFANARGFYLPENSGGGRLFIQQIEQR